MGEYYTETIPVQYLYNVQSIQLPLNYHLGAITVAFRHNPTSPNPLLKEGRLLNWLQLSWPEKQKPRSGIPERGFCQLIFGTSGLTANSQWL